MNHFVFSVKRNANGQSKYNRQTFNPNSIWGGGGGVKFTRRRKIKKKCPFLHNSKDCTALMKQIFQKLNCTIGEKAKIKNEIITLW